MDSVTGSLIWAPVLLTFAVAMWAGGFETIYGTMDIEFGPGQPHTFDLCPFRRPERHPYHESAAHRGRGRPAGAGILMNLNVFYFIGWAVAVVLLVYENKPGKVRRTGQSWRRVCVQQIYFFPIAALYDSRGRRSHPGVFPMVSSESTFAGPIPPVVIGLTGASGAIIGREMVDTLLDLEIPVRSGSVQRRAHGMAGRIG